MSVPPANAPPPVLLAAPLLACAAGWAYLRLSSNVAVKRVVLLITLIATAALFLTMLWTVRGRIAWPSVVILLASLVVAYKNVAFCSHCGATARGSVFNRIRFCSKCGSEIRR
jgi:hypothetical protein